MTDQPKPVRRPRGNTVAWCVLVGSLLATAGLQFVRMQAARRAESGDAVLLRLALNSWWMSPTQVAAVARQYPTNPEGWCYLSVRCEREVYEAGRLEPPPTESEAAQLRAYWLWMAEGAARRATELDAAAVPFMRAAHRRQLAAAVGE